MRDEPQITAYDTLMGDGDCGTTLVTGATTITDAISSIRVDSLSHAMVSISDLISKGMGGTSGAMYAIFFTSFAAAVQTSNSSLPIVFQAVAEMASRALDTLRRYAKANVGDRTMMDALIPLISELCEGAKAGLTAVDTLQRATTAAAEGCNATRSMRGVFGRSTYVGAGEEADDTKGIPDPGAMGVVAISQGILDAVLVAG